MGSVGRRMRQETGSRTSDSYHIERCPAHPVADIQSNALRFLQTIDCLLLDEPYPPVLQLFSFVEYKWNQRP